MSLLPFPDREDVDTFYQTDDIYDFLGQGTFATVYKAVSLFDAERVKQGEVVALKVITKRDLASEKMFRDIINEVEVLRRVDHPNCARLLDYFQTPLYVVIVMEYIPGKELFQALRETDFTENMVRSVIKQTLNALRYLHESVHVVHRDVKPENVLVTLLDSGEYHVTLVDFGLSRFFGQQSTRRRLGRGAFAQLQRVASFPPPRDMPMDALDSSTDSPLLTTPCGTLKYAAPETIKSINQSAQLATTRSLLPRVDVYAAGVLMYVMLCGTLPFRDFSNKAGLYREMESGPTFGGPRWENVSKESIALNMALLIMDPKKRPRAEEALQYEWFQLASSIDSEGNDSKRLPVDEILGHREYIIKAFDAMKPHSTSLYQQMDGGSPVSSPMGGRCVAVHFPHETPEPSKGYFSFQ